jgi:hypothetical protein
MSSIVLNIMPNRLLLITNVLFRYTAICCGCSAQLRGRRPEGVAKLGTVDHQLQDEARKPKVQDAVLNQRNVQVKRRSTIEDDILAVSAAYKYGIVWHSTDVEGGSGVPYDKPGDGGLIPVRTKYCMAHIRRIVCVNPQHTQVAYNIHPCTHRTRAHPATRHSVAIPTS